MQGILTLGQGWRPIGRLPGYNRAIIPNPLPAAWFQGSAFPRPGGGPDLENASHPGQASLPVCGVHLTGRRQWVNHWGMNAEGPDESNAGRPPNASYEDEAPDEAKVFGKGFHPDCIDTRYNIIRDYALDTKCEQTPSRQSLADFDAFVSEHDCQKMARFVHGFRQSRKDYHYWILFVLVRSLSDFSGAIWFSWILKKYLDEEAEKYAESTRHAKAAQTFRLIRTRMKEAPDLYQDCLETVLERARQVSIALLPLTDLQRQGLDPLGAVAICKNTPAFMCDEKGEKEMEKIEDLIAKIQAINFKTALDLDAEGCEGKSDGARSPATPTGAGGNTQEQLPQPSSSDHRNHNPSGVASPNKAITVKPALAPRHIISQPPDECYGEIDRLATNKLYIFHRKNKVGRQPALCEPIKLNDSQYKILHFGIEKARRIAEEGDSGQVIADDVTFILSWNPDNLAEIICDAPAYESLDENKKVNIRQIMQSIRTLIEFDANAIKEAKKDKIGLVTSAIKQIRYSTIKFRFRQATEA